MNSKLTTITAAYVRQHYPRLYKKIQTDYTKADGKGFDFTAALTLYMASLPAPQCEICGKLVVVTKKFRTAGAKARCRKHINTNSTIAVDQLIQYSAQSNFKIVKVPEKILVGTDFITIKCEQHGEYTQQIKSYLNGAQCQQCYGLAMRGVKKHPHSQKTKLLLSAQKVGKPVNLSAEAKYRKTTAQKEAWVNRKKNAAAYNQYIESLKNRRLEYIRKSGFTFPKKEKTSLERKFETFLIEKNLTYQTQYLFNGKKFDFYIEELDLLVEVDGEYWHNKPSSIKNDITKHQICTKHNASLVRISSDNFIPEIIFADAAAQNRHTTEILKKRGINGF